MIIWHNGTFKNDGEFSFGLTDRVRYGDGVFDTMLCVDGNLIAAKDHLERLYAHAYVLRIPVVYDENEILCAVADVAKANGLNFGPVVVNIIISRGAGPRGLMPPEDQNPEVIIIVSAAPSEYSPVHAIIAQSVRRNEGSPLSRTKSLNYGNNILGLIEAKEKSANEALLLNNKGNLACASSSNVYILKDQKLLTPPLSDGAVDGIVRKKLIAGGSAVEKILELDNTQEAEGLFLSNSIRGLYPVTSLDGKTLPLAKLPIDPHFHTKLSF